jgi:hypothetical protein
MPLTGHVQFGGGLRGKGLGTQGTSPRGLPCARLLEAQSPAVQTFTPPDTASVVGAVDIGAIPTFVALNPSGRRATGSEPVQGDGPGRLRHARYVWRREEFRMAYGARALRPRRSVEVAGVTTCQGGRESRSARAKGPRCSRSTRTVRYARCEMPQPYWRSFVNAAGEDCRWIGCGFQRWLRIS